MAIVFGHHHRHHGCVDIDVPWWCYAVYFGFWILVAGIASYFMFR